MKVWTWMAVEGLNNPFTTHGVFNYKMDAAVAEEAAKYTTEGYLWGGLYPVSPLKNGGALLMTHDALPWVNYDMPLEQLAQTNVYEEAVPAYTAYFEALKKRNVTPSRIILDHENYFGLWTLIQSGWSSRLADLYKSSIKLPLSWRKYSPEDFINIFNTPNHPERVEVEFLFDSWCLQQTTRSLRQTVLDTFIKAFGKRVSVSNFMDWLGPDNYPCHYYFGSRVARGSVAGSSSPPLYLSGAEYGRALATSKKTGLDPKWCTIIDYVNIVRAASALSTEVMPWVSGPDYISDNSGFSEKMNPWWRALILAIRPYCNGFLYWNYQSKQDAFAVKVFNEARTIPHNGNFKTYKPLPETTKVLKAGNFTIRHDDLVKG